MTFLLAHAIRLKCFSVLLGFALVFNKVYESFINKIIIFTFLWLCLSLKPAFFLSVLLGDLKSLKWMKRMEETENKNTHSTLTKGKSWKKLNTSLEAPCSELLYLFREPIRNVISLRTLHPVAGFFKAIISKN